jgi:hypothetical protein
MEQELGNAPFFLPSINRKDAEDLLSAAPQLNWYNILIINNILFLSI